MNFDKFYSNFESSVEITKYPFQSSISKNATDNQISKIFMDLNAQQLDRSRSPSKEWNLRSRASDPRGESLRFSNLIERLTSQIDLTQHPQLADFLKESKSRVDYSVALGNSLSDTLGQQRKELVKVLSQLTDPELQNIHLKVFDIPKGFCLLIPLVEIEKKIQELEAIPDQSLDQVYDELTLDQIPVGKISFKTKQLIEVVSILAELQDFDRIYALTQSHGQIKGVLLGVLFDYFIHHNRLNQALGVVRSIPMTGQKVALLLQLAQLYQQDPVLQAKSEEILQEAYSYLKDLTPKERQLISPLAEEFNIHNLFE